MKVGIDISQIVFAGTGVATYTRNLVEKILETDKKNEYILFGSSLRQQQALKSFLPGVAHVTLPLPPTVLEPLWNRLHVVPTQWLIGDVDVFHTSNWTEPPSGAQKVTTIHDLVTYKFPSSSHPRIIAAEKRKLEWVKKEEKAVIAVSQSTKRDIVDILGIPEKKITVIYEAAGKIFEGYSNITISEKDTKIKAVKRKYKLDKPFILVVGTREPRKNLDRVVRAFEKLNDKNFELVFAGRYGWGKDIKGIRTLGYVPHEELAPLYNSAAAYIYCSLYEGFGIPVLEAFWCSCPVITSDISSLPEVGGKAAIYADPLSISDIAQKIEYVVGLSKSKRDEIAKRGLFQAQKFSWEKAASETIKVYEELA